MEKWQKQHVKDNLPELIQNVNCDALFLSYLCKFGVIGDADMKKLEAKGALDGQYEKTKCFLDILVTRTGAYEQLAKSLYACRQTGALLILLRGAENNLNDQNPFQSCGIHLNEAEQQILLTREVIFEGKAIPLKQVCKSIDDSTLQNIVISNLDAASYQQFLAGAPITIATETIPEPLPYYVARTLSIATQLDPKIFQKLDADVFCIDGMELHQLSSLAKAARNSLSSMTRETTDRSRNQIHRLTSRFILLESHQHYETISKNSDKVVHWIKFEGGNYFYVKSNTGIGVTRIQEFLQSRTPEFILEDDFVQDCLDAPTNSPILLYDSPGMGKSVLLAELARKAANKEPNRNVIYFNISDFIRKLSCPPRNCTSARLKQSLANIITTNGLGRSIVQNLLDDGNHYTELFLDAYDEVQETDLDRVNSILEFIAKECRNIRMWITTRPHKRHELEAKFGVHGYNIVPFNDANKISFFIKYWQTQHGVTPTEETHVFAEYCLKSLTKSISSRESDIAGIPLQCRLLADIFAEEVKGSGPVCTEPHLQFNSMHKMYKQFMDVKFENSSSDPETQAIKQLHVKIAVFTLFTKFVVMEDFDASGVDNAAVYRLGILEPSESGPFGMKFVHRTFAEFLAAEFLATFATDERPRSSQDIEHGIDLLFGSALGRQFIPTITPPLWSYLHHSFIHPVCVQFIDFFFSTEYSDGKDLKQFKHGIRRSKHYNQDALLELLTASLKPNSVCLFTYLLDLYLDLQDSGDTPATSVTFRYSPCIVEEWEGKGAQKLIMGLQKHADMKKLVSIAAECSSLELLKLSCKFVESVTGRPWHEFRYEGEYSPICASVRRGQYQIVEYLLTFDREEFYEEPLLHLCLEGNHESSAEVIADKVQIVKLILQERPNMLNRRYLKYNHVPLLTRWAPFYLIKCLIEAGADLTITRNGDNIAHRAAEHFSADEYHELVSLIISRNENIVFKQRTRNGLTPVHWALFFIELKTETLEILSGKCGVDFNDNNNEWEHGKSELAIATDSGRGERVINDILRLGGDRNKMAKGTPDNTKAVKRRCTIQ